MKPIVVYSSGTGFTQRYAEAIANKLECEVISIKEIKNKPLHTYDLVVYGGSLMANMLRSYSKIAKMNLSNIVVFAVGFSEPSEDNMSLIKSQNHLDNIPCFYMRGGINYNKLGFIKKKMLMKVTGETENIDCCDPKYIEDLIEFIQKSY